MFIARSRTPRIRRAAVLAIVLGTGGIALAQPADRPAAFLSAVNTAIANAPPPAHLFYEAELVNDGGTWIFDVTVAPANAASVSEFEINASSFAILNAESKAPSSGKQAKILAVFNLLPQATTSLAQALTIITPYTPDGTQMRKVEMEVESAPATFQFEFASPDGSIVKQLKVDAVTGAATGGSGGGGGMPPPGGTTLTQANQIALALYPNSKLVGTEFDDDRNLWEVRLVTAGGDDRKVKIDAATGNVLEDDTDHRSSEDHADDRLVLNGLAGAGITLAQATQLALTAVPGSTPVKSEWEYEHGVLVAKVIVQETAGLRTLFFAASNGSPVTPTPPAAPEPDPIAMISPARATELAVLAVPGSVPVEVEYESQGGRAFYEVKTIKTNPLRLRKIIIDARTSMTWDITILPMSSTYIAKAQQNLVRRQGIIKSFRDAQLAALNVLGSGQIKSMELEPEGSGLIYRAKVLVGEKLFDLTIDPNTAAVRPQ